MTESLFLCKKHRNVFCSFFLAPHAKLLGPLTFMLAQLHKLRLLVNIILNMCTRQGKAKQALKNTTYIFIL